MEENNRDNVPADEPCVNFDIKNKWTIGSVLIVLVIIFTMAMFKSSDGRGQRGLRRSTALDRRENMLQVQAMQGFGQNRGPSNNAVGRRCPFCNFSLMYPGVTLDGAINCPNCFRNIGTSNTGNNAFNQVAYQCPVGGAFNQVAYQSPVGGGFTQVALPAGCATCPNAAQCFPPGQQVAFANNILPPPISRNAAMFHQYRGVCSNCHTILNNGARVR